MRLSCWIAFTVIPIAVLRAETFDERHVRDLAAGPGDLQFRLSVAAPGGPFHAGERIPIALEFSSSSPEKYRLDGATYDRSGRLRSEEFVLERTDVVDPFQDYFRSSLFGGIGGGLRNSPVLEAKPHQINLDLNDWFRFDHAGRYRLYLKSHRLTRLREPGVGGERTEEFAAVSNLIEVEILPPDLGWETAKLAEIHDVLQHPLPERPKPGGPPVPVDPFEGKRVLAQRELRFLATPGAIQLALKIAARSGASPDMLTIIGARDRADATAAFERHLTDPQVGIHEWDVRVRALLTFIERHKTLPLPEFDWQLPKNATRESIEAAARTGQLQFADLLREEAVRLIPTVRRKDPAAAKISAVAIAALAPEAARKAGLIPPDDYGLTREQMVAQFLEFSAERQNELLGKKWDMVRGPEMTSVLRRFVEQAAPGPAPKTAMALRIWGLDSGAEFAALRRLFELAPEQGSDFLRKDIASGKPRFAGYAVRQFSAQEIPETDGVLSAALKTDLDSGIALAAKFGTVHLADEIRTIYSNRPMWPCAEEEFFLTYFVRTSPRDEAMRVLRRAMADRQRGCWRTMFAQVGQMVWNQAIETVAIETLNDSTAEAVTGATRALAGHGSPSAELPLWKRLEQWSRAWKGRAEELENNPITGVGPFAEKELGFALFGAITSAKSWLFDEPRRKRLLELCIDEACRMRIGNEWPLDAAVPIDVTNGGELYPAAFRAGAFAASSFEELEAKLRQFPAGARFRWCTQSGNPFDAFSDGQRQEMFDRLSAFLAARSITLEPYVADKCMPGAAR
jgi:hypothetical protein